MQLTDAATGRPFNLVAFVAEAFAWDEGEQVFMLTATTGPPQRIEFARMAEAAESGDAVAVEVLRRTGWERTS